MKQIENLRDSDFKGVRHLSLITNMALKIEYRAFNNDTMRLWFNSYNKKLRNELLNYYESVGVMEKQPLGVFNDFKFTENFLEYAFRSRRCKNE